MEATPSDRWTPKTPCPLAKSDWVLEKSIQHPQIGQVEDCYWDGSSEEWVMDIALYGPDGNFIGRSSPSMGGPEHIEPAVPVAHWERIEKPTFPLCRDTTGFRDWRDGTVKIDFRTE
jgi:hypothetical protein